MDESLEGLSWLLTQIEAIPSVMATLTGGVWPIEAPEGCPVPFAVLSPMGGHDRHGVAAYRLMWEGVIAVRLWGLATASDALTTAANTIDATLQPGGVPSKGTTAHAQIMACWRDQPLTPLPDWTGQALRIGIGGLYRLQVRGL